MRREYRILSALGHTDVPHPAVIALCEDPAVLGCVFFLMERVEGVSPFPAPLLLDDDEHRADIVFALIDALALLHEVDWHGSGLQDLGRPEGFHDRQVERWGRQLASYNGRRLPDVGRVSRWLASNLPESFEPSIMHGDFHMGNALIAPDPPVRVVAVLDWETATIGDPLLDLAGFCEIWCSMATSGWPGRDAMIARYCSGRGIGSVGDLTYYEVLYNFRLSVLLEGIYQRSLQDPTRSDQHDIGKRALYNMARAAELISHC
jgi:aminoglycoside phosphotransferase (APT) family kinase protein